MCEGGVISGASWRCTPVAPKFCFVETEGAGTLTGAGAGVCACSVFDVVLDMLDAAGAAGSELLSVLCNNDVLGISVGAGGARGAGGAGGAVVVIVAGVVAAAGLMPSEIKSLDMLVLVGSSSLAIACCVASCHWPGGGGWPGGCGWPGGDGWPGGVPAEFLAVVL